MWKSCLIPRLHCRESLRWKCGNNVCYLDFTDSSLISEMTEILLAWLRLCSWLGCFFPGCWGVLPPADGRQWSAWCGQVGLRLGLWLVLVLNVPYWRWFCGQSTELFSCRMVRWVELLVQRDGKPGVDRCVWDWVYASFVILNVFLAMILRTVYWAVFPARCWGAVLKQGLQLPREWRRPRINSPKRYGTACTYFLAMVFQTVYWTVFSAGSG